MAHSCGVAGRDSASPPAAGGGEHRRRGRGEDPAAGGEKLVVGRMRMHGGGVVRQALHPALLQRTRPAEVLRGFVFVNSQRLR